MQANVLLLQGNAAAVQQQHPRAIELLGRALALQPALTRALFERGLSHAALAEGAPVVVARPPDPTPFAPVASSSCRGGGGGGAGTGAGRSLRLRVRRSDTGRAGGRRTSPEPVVDDPLAVLESLYPNPEPALFPPLVLPRAGGAPGDGDVGSSTDAEAAAPEAAPDVSADVAAAGPGDALHALSSSVPSALPAPSPGPAALRHRALVAALRDLDAALALQPSHAAAAAARCALLLALRPPRGEIEMSSSREGAGPREECWAPSKASAAALNEAAASALGPLEACLRCHPQEPALLTLLGRVLRRLGRPRSAGAADAAARACRERKPCVVCLDGDREGRLRPCHHAALCKPCADSLVKGNHPCPICGAAIEGVDDGTFGSTFARGDAGRLGGGEGDAEAGADMDSDADHSTTTPEREGRAAAAARAAGGNVASPSWLPPTPEHAAVAGSAARASSPACSGREGGAEGTSGTLLSPRPRRLALGEGEAEIDSAIRYPPLSERSGSRVDVSAWTVGDGGSPGGEGTESTAGDRCVGARGADADDSVGDLTPPSGPALPLGSPAGQSGEMTLSPMHSGAAEGDGIGAVGPPVAASPATPAAAAPVAPDAASSSSGGSPGSDATVRLTPSVAQEVDLAAGGDGGEVILPRARADVSDDIRSAGAGRVRTESRIARHVPSSSRLGPTAVPQTERRLSRSPLVPASSMRARGATRAKRAPRTSRDPSRGREGGAAVGAGDAAGVLMSPSGDSTSSGSTQPRSTRPHDDEYVLDAASVATPVIPTADPSRDSAVADWRRQGGADEGESPTTPASGGVSLARGLEGAGAQSAVFTSLDAH